MITPEQHAEIRRLYYGEHWKVGTIAAALGVHHDTVRAALLNDTQGVRRGTCRATRLDPYLPLIRETLAQYPRLRATRLFEMVKSRGYTGSVVQLRRAVRLIRPAAAPTVYRRLTTLAGEEAQVDWGSFGSIRIGRGVRPLSGFVMVLSYSRARWFTTIDVVRCSNAPAPQFAFIRDSSSSPVIITSPHGPVHPGAATKKGQSSVRFSTCATPSLRRARLSTWTS
jgi:hypothetical protein